MLKAITSSTMLKKNGTYLIARCLLSSSASQVNVEVNDKTGIALVTLNRPPVNSLNLEFLNDISNAFDEVQNNRSKGMVITSVS